ncbi:LuxR C-terminal-related transcriptional regulator [Adlercreutzia sp. R25]|uniref:response regulator transcription factor n=1 Tax=Adlercreutzia shanghongiae TaxID=3111773 RepID=UPI002DBE4043|nr:LuxR C-terminal-related transcriptional regulator [Adlercreutzia sp. R25]MEC4273082.1 LuxR C-terminal-related transcriptional regulator [Adlercreutzia sp. R25]
MDNHPNSTRPFAPLVFIGLGLGWAAEEIVTLCASRLLVEELGLSAPLYLIYLPLFAFFGLLFAASKPIDRILEKPATSSIILGLGMLGILIIALMPHRAVCTIAGTVLFAASTASINVLWFVAFTALPLNLVRKAVLFTALITALGTFLWSLPDTALLVVAFVALGGSVLCYERVHAKWKPSSVRLSTAKPQHIDLSPRRLSAILGVCIIMMGFGFLQYTVYQFTPPAMPWSETISHVLSLALLGVSLYLARGAEFSFGAKLATTLTLFSFVLLAVSRDAMGVSVLLAAGVEGMLELIVLLALVEYAKRSSRSPFFIGGIWMMLTGLMQWLGCLLSLAEHAALPSLSYSMFGLAIVALLIVDAVWLLNDTTVTAFLWEQKPSESTALPDRTPFEDRAAAVARAHKLTARETEVMELFAKGRSATYIAESFCVSNNTVRSHILHLYAKCDVHSRQELITLIDGWPDDSGPLSH